MTKGITDSIENNLIRLTHFLLTLLFLFFYDGTVAQENLPLGTWREHTSYNKIIDVAFGNTEIYAAAENGVMIFNTVDQSITTLTKCLRNGGIQCKL